MAVTQFNFPTPIRFGAGAIKELPEQLSRRALRRPLIVADSGIAKLDFFTATLEQLKKNSLAPAAFTEFSGNPVESHVKAGVTAYHNHDADCLVLLGGGAALDVGKAVALMVHHPGQLFDYEDGKPDGRPVDKAIPFMVAIPTTAGTGSEVGRSSVISDDKSKAKKIIFAPKLLPPLVLADPELTFGLPPEITAHTGMDALTHCVEAFLVNSFHPMADGIAWEGVRLIATNLEKAVQDPRNLEARSAMLCASMMGAVAFQKGLGATHSCAHALSTVFDLHHGLANALMIRACMHFNKETSARRLARLALATDNLEKDPLKGATAFLTWLDRFKERVGIKKTLKHYGVQVNDNLISIAYADVCHASNPRPVTPGDFKALFEQSL